MAAAAPVQIQPVLFSQRFIDAYYAKVTANNDLEPEQIYENLSALYGSRNSLLLVRQGNELREKAEIIAKFRRIKSCGPILVECLGFKGDYISLPGHTASEPLPFHLVTWGTMKIGSKPAVPFTETFVLSGSRCGSSYSYSIIRSDLLFPTLTTDIDDSHNEFFAPADASSSGLPGVHVPPRENGHNDQLLAHKKEASDAPAAARSPCAQSQSFQSSCFPHRAFAFFGSSWRKWRVKEEHVQRAICQVLPSISTSDFRVQLLPYLNPPHNDDDSDYACRFHQGTIVSFAKQNQYDALLEKTAAFDELWETHADKGQLLLLKFHELSNPSHPFSYMANVATLGCIVNLRSSVARFLRHLHPPQHFSSFIRPHVDLSSGQQPPSGNECLRLIACCGLHSKLLSKLFGSKFCSHSCSPLTFSILRRVSAKLAAATPECEAASVIAWCRQVFYLGCEFHSKRRMLEDAANAISQLALSTNGRLALVSCGACALLVDIMLSPFHEYPVKGCEFGRYYGSDCEDQRCEHDYYSSLEHHCYVRAALCLASCTAGAYNLNRAGWNPYWVVVREYYDESPWDKLDGSHWRACEYDVLIEDLRQRGLRAVGVPPVIRHFPNHFCECVRAESRSKVLLALPEASIDSVRFSWDADSFLPPELCCSECLKFEASNDAGTVWTDVPHAMVLGTMMVFEMQKSDLDPLNVQFRVVLRIPSTSTKLLSVISRDFEFLGYALDAASRHPKRPDDSIVTFFNLPMFYHSTHERRMNNGPCLR